MLYINQTTSLSKTAGMEVYIWRQWRWYISAKHKEASQRTKYVDSKYHFILNNRKKDKEGNCKGVVILAHMKENLIQQWRMYTSSISMNIDNGLKRYREQEDGLIDGGDFINTLCLVTCKE